MESDSYLVSLLIWYSRDAVFEAIAATCWIAACSLSIVTDMLNRQSTIISAIIAVILILAPTQAFSDSETGNTWLSHTTKYVEIVYQRHDAQSMRELAACADDVYEQVSKYVGSTVGRKVLCVLRSHTAFANGSYYPIAPHINIITTAPSGPLMASTTEGWIKVVFAHELEHYLQLQKDEGFFGILSKIFGPSVAAVTGAFTPGWMIEGPAIVAETISTSGGRGRNLFFDLPARAMITEGRLFTLNQAAHGSRFPPGGRIYLAGYLIHDYLEDRFGDEVFASILARFARFPVFGPWQAIRAETGSSASTIYREMIADLQNRYAPAAGSIRGELVSPDTTGNYYLPRITSDGWLVYRTRPDAVRGIVRYDPHTQEEQMVLPARLSDGYSYTATSSGDTIVIATPFSKLSSTGVATTSELFSYDVAADELTRLTHSGDLRHPELTPDGARLIAVKQEKSYASLVEIDQTTGEQLLLLRLERTNLYNPAISADGTTAYFVMNTLGNQDIGAIDLSATVTPLHDAPDGPYNDELIRFVTNTPDIGEYYPRVSDGILIFGTDRTDTLELAGIDVATGNTYRFADDPVGAFAGFTDDGSLVYASYAPTGFSLHTSSSELSAFAPQQNEHMLSDETRSDAHPATSDTHEDIVDSDTAFIDVPRFAFWLSLPYVTDPFTNSLTAFGPGAMVYLQSPVGGHEIYAEASVRTDVWQPGIQIEAMMYPATHTLRLYLAHGYSQSSTGVSAQTSEISVKHTIPVSLYDRFPVYRAVSMAWLARYRIGQEDFAPFTPFAGSFSPTHDLVLALIAGARISQRGNTLNAVAPWGLSLAARIDTTIIKSLPAYPLVNSSFSIAGTVPVASSNHAVTVSINTGIRSSSYNLPVGTPIGGFSPPVHAGMIDSLVTLTYHTPVLPLDLTVPFGFHLGALNAALFSQGYLSYTPNFTIDPHVYFGGELEVEFGKTVHFPLTFGISTRISTLNPGNYLPTEDIKIYINMGNLSGTIIGDN